MSRWLSDREFERVLPADKAAFDSPVPTQTLSQNEVTYDLPTTPN